VELGKPQEEHMDLQGDKQAEELNKCKEVLDRISNLVKE
jgi:hypothetical protein